MTAIPDPNHREPPGTIAAVEWAEIAADAPEMAITMGRYLRQISTFLAPRSVEVADAALRQLARWTLTNTGIETVGQFRRDDIEDFKVWLSSRPGHNNGSLSTNTHRQRLRTLRAFFERIIEWDWPDAPVRNPILASEIPKKPEPLPKFLDDRDAAKLMAAARSAADLRDRVVVELLARTGMRAGELADLDADAVVRIGHAHWLRIPLGKLRNDRYVPLHPELVGLLTEWTALHSDHIRRHHRLIADERGVLDRHMIGRIVKRIGRRAGIKVHPHQLRHTLATQANLSGVATDATFDVHRERNGARGLGIRAAAQVPKVVALSRR
jgi:site-specific recombinase XerD